MLAAYFLSSRCHFQVISLNQREIVMKSSLKLSLIAGLLAVAGVAYSQSPMMGGQCDPAMGGMQGHGMRHDRMGKMDPVKMQAMMDKRNAALKAQLKLTPAQEAAWTTYTTAMKPPADMMTRQRPDPAEMAKLTTPERIDKMKALRTQHMNDMNAFMDKHAEATKAFYAVLTPEQQKTFDASAMMGHGPRGQRDGKGMMQPKP
jgi:Spy/CpxP family protein refolding chaperone